MSGKYARAHWFLVLLSDDGFVVAVPAIAILPIQFLPFLTYTVEVTLGDAVECAICGRRKCWIALWPPTAQKIKTICYINCGLCGVPTLKGATRSSVDAFSVTPIGSHLIGRLHPMKSCKFRRKDNEKSAESGAVSTKANTRTKAATYSGRTHKRMCAFHSRLCRQSWG